MTRYLKIYRDEKEKFLLFFFFLHQMLLFSRLHNKPDAVFLYKSREISNTPRNFNLKTKNIHK